MHSMLVALTRRFFAQSSRTQGAHPRRRPLGAAQCLRGAAALTVLVSLGCSGGADSTALVPISVGFGSVAYIDPQGRVVIPPITDATRGQPFKQGRAAVHIGSKVGFIDRSGKLVIPARFDQAGFGGFSENGLIPVRVGDEWGYIDTEGEWAIPARFEAAHGFNDDGLAGVKFGGKWGKIDGQGNPVIAARYDNLGGVFSANGLLPAKIGHRWGYVNREGELVIPVRFEAAHGFAENGRAPVKERGRWGFIDADGEWVVPPRFERASSFTANGFAAVERDGAWGYIDHNGGWAIPPRYDTARSFAGNGTAAVEVQGSWGYIGEDGEWVIPARFEQVRSFGEDGFAEVRVFGKWGRINEAGKFVIPPSFEQTLSFPENGLAAIKRGGYQGYVNEKGKIVAIGGRRCGRHVLLDGDGGVTWPEEFDATCSDEQASRASVASTSARGNETTASRPAQADRATRPGAAGASASGNSESPGVIVGNPDAPDTLEIFFSIGCQHCIRAFETSLAQLQSPVQSGKLKILFVDVTPVFGSAKVREATIPASKAIACVAENLSSVGYMNTLSSFLDLLKTELPRTAQRHSWAVAATDDFRPGSGIRSSSELGARFLAKSGVSASACDERRYGERQVLAQARHRAHLRPGQMQSVPFYVLNGDALGATLSLPVLDRKLADARRPDGGRMPALGLAVRIPDLEGCYGPIEFDANDPKAAPKRVAGPMLRYEFRGGGSYAVWKQGAEVGSAAFAPAAGIAHYAEGSTRRTDGAVGTEISIDTVDRMHRFMAANYEKVLEDPEFGTVQLVGVALHSDVFGGAESASGSYGYYVFSYANPGLIVALRLDPFDDGIRRLAARHGVSISGTPDAPRISGGDAALYRFFKALDEHQDSNGANPFGYARTECDSAREDVARAAAAEEQRPNRAGARSASPANARPAASDAASARSLYLKGLRAHSAGDYPRARKLFLQACTAGHTQGCVDLGMLMIGGKGGARDLSAARELLNGACRAGNDVACTHARRIAQDGSGAN